MLGERDRVILRKKDGFWGEEGKVISKGGERDVIEKIGRRGQLLFGTAGYFLSHFNLFSPTNFCPKKAIKTEIVPT